MEMEAPSDGLLVAMNRLMYWTDWGSPPKIERASLDGDRRQTIVEGELKWPNGLVIDSASRRLYWADAALDKIEMSNLQVNRVNSYSISLVIPKGYTKRLRADFLS